MSGLAPYVNKFTPQKKEFLHLLFPVSLGLNKVPVLSGSSVNTSCLSAYLSNNGKKKSIIIGRKKKEKLEE